MHVKHTKRLCFFCVSLLIFSVAIQSTMRLFGECVHSHLGTALITISSNVTWWVFFSPRFSNLSHPMDCAFFFWYIRLAIVAYHFPCNVGLSLSIDYVFIILSAYPYEYVFNMFFVRVSLLRLPSPISSSITQTHTHKTGGFEKSQLWHCECMHSFT